MTDLDIDLNAEESLLLDEAVDATATGGTPRVLAFGGSYPIDVTVPGSDGFTDTFLFEVPMFAGGDPPDDGFAGFVREHGFGAAEPPSGASAMVPWLIGGGIVLVLLVIGGIILAIVLTRSSRRQKTDQQESDGQ